MSLVSAEKPSIGAFGMWPDEEEKIMVRVTLSVVGGLLLFALAAFVMGAVAKELWPEYAAADPNRAYTLPLLWSRLASGAAATIFAAWLAVLLGKQSLKTGFLIGVALLTVSIPWHVRIWDEYPVWYHLTWFAITIPSALLGGRLARS